MRLLRGPLPNLLFNLVRRDLAVRYKSTVLGFFWSFLKPLALTAIFYLVFQRILTIEIPAGEQIPFALFLLTGMLAWNCFAGATSEALHVVEANANLVKKVKLPLVVFPLATVCSHFVHFLLALLVLGGLLILCGLPPGPWALLVPLVLALQFLFTLAVCLVLSSLNVFYRDVASIWEVLLTAWLYATPVIYPANLALARLNQVGPAGPEGLSWLSWAYLLNPLSVLVLLYRRLLLYAPLESPQLELPADRLFWGAIGLGFLVSLLSLALGRVVFRHFSRSFADEL